MGMSCRGVNDGRSVTRCFKRSIARAGNTRSLGSSVASAKISCRGNTHVERTGRPIFISFAYPKFFAKIFSANGHFVVSCNRRRSVRQRSTTMRMCGAIEHPTHQAVSHRLSNGWISRTSRTGEAPPLPLTKVVARWLSIELIWSRNGQFEATFGKMGKVFVCKTTFVVA